jgi:formamidopyrimidine-DNA glycosylase
MKTTPIDPEFTFDCFCKLIDEVLLIEKKSVKGLLTQDQLIPGLGNSIAQDIMFNARLHPKHPIDELDIHQRPVLFYAIQNTLQSVIQNGGRYDEFDLFGKPGNYIRIMDKNVIGRPCQR